MAKRKRERTEATPEILKGRVMLRVSEYSQLTGTPAPTVYKYLASGEIPAIRIGGTVRIPVSALLEQIQGQSGRG
jgi:excisionase family DNA binding protein